MGEVKNQLFLQRINNSLEEVRSDFRKKHTPKKDNRFLIKGITYEIGPCTITPAGYSFEISSKIPQEALPKKVTIDKYFKEVVKLINKKPKKPVDSKMESIIRSSEEEVKERDYVKLTYCYKEDELYTLAEVDKRIKKYIAKGIPIPEVPGVATPAGKMVLHLLDESIKTNARQNILDLCDANEIVKKEFEGKSPSGKAPSPTAAKKSAPAPKPKPAAVKKPAVAKKPVAVKKPAPKPAAKKKPAPAKKAVPAKSAKKPAITKAKAKPTPAKAPSKKAKR
jgi:hypothetical protein